MIRFLVNFWVAVAAGAIALPAVAQPYPSKPIRLIVPFPPGGGNDIVARVINIKLPALLGQNLIVDNRAGAGGNLGAELAAKAPADGYTLFIANNSLTTNLSLYAKLPYDPFRDFAPIALGATSPNMIVVHPALPARNVRELITLAKTRPGQLHFASGSTGSAGHLAGELFKTMAGVDLIHVPYKGAAPAVVDLLGGHVEMMFDNLASALPNVRAERLRALAVTTRARSVLLPELVTLDEGGLKGFDIGTWFGVLAPAATPRDIVNTLNGGILRALAAPATRERFAALGALPAGGTPEQFAALIKSEIAKYEKIVRASGASAD